MLCWRRFGVLWQSFWCILVVILMYFGVVLVYIGSHFGVLRRRFGVCWQSFWCISASFWCILAYFWYCFSSLGVFRIVRVDASATSLRGVTLLAQARRVGAHAVGTVA